MKLFINNYTGFVLILLVSVCSWATEGRAQVKDYAACLAAWDSKMQTLKTDFTQTTEYDGLLISRSDGRLYFSQKGPQLRLDNLDGNEITQTALTDKKTIYILDEKGKEVSKLSWAEWVQSQPNQALFDFGNYTALLAKHTITSETPKDGVVRLILTPKNKDEYVLYVTVSEEDCFPLFITVKSDLMQTSAVLTAREVNGVLTKELFKGLK